MARPSKLTDEVRLTICDGIRLGVTFEEACRRAGVAPSTGWEWRARGEGRDPRRRATTRHVLFAESVAQVEHDRESGGKAVGPPFAELPEFSEFSESLEGFAEAEGFSQFSQSVEGFAEIFTSVTRAMQCAPRWKSWTLSARGAFRPPMWA